jgi:hypothetical protein
MFFTNFLQDGTLVTTRSPEPKYLPTIMGGAGSPSNYGDPRNLLLYMLSYKGGGYSRVYGTSTQEIRDCLYQLEIGKGYLPPHFTLKLRDKQEYLHGTYAEKVFVPTEAYSSGLRGQLPAPLYELGGNSNVLASYEARLVAAKVLINRTQAEVEVERTARTNDVLFGYETQSSLKAKKAFLSREGRAGFEGALSANTAFSNLLTKTASKKDVNAMMKDPAFNVVLTGAREFTLDHAKWINLGMPSDTYSIRDLFKCQDMFLRSEVSTEEDMKVSGITRTWRRGGKYVETQTKAEVGLWQVSVGMFQWAQEIGTKLVQLREEMVPYRPTLPRPMVARLYLDNREEVSDDPLILEALKQKAASGIATDNLCIITSDVRLCKAAARETGLSIYRISPFAMPLIFQDEDMEDQVLALEGSANLVGKYINLAGKPRIIYTMVDTGSLYEMLAKHDVTDVGEGRQLYSFQTTKFSKNSLGNRTETISYSVPTEYETLEDSMLRKMRDKNNMPFLQVIRPEKTAFSKLPKFESYAKGSNRSSKGSVSSRTSGGSRKLPSEKE